MYLISQPFLSNGMYLLLSFVGFLVYAFLYLSYQGILSGKKENVLKRPTVTGFDSMRRGNTDFPPYKQPTLQNLDSQVGAAEEASFFFDPQATFHGSQPDEHTTSEENMPQEDPNNRNENSQYTQENANEEEDENFDWPSPGENANVEGTEENDKALIGALTPEEIQLLSQVRFSLATDSDAYPYLKEEYQEIQERVARLMNQAGKSQEEVVMAHLNSREKVILNAFSMGSHTVVS